MRSQRPSAWVGIVAAGQAQVCQDAKSHRDMECKMASKEQKEGVARVLDTLAASCVIGFTVSMSGYTVLSWQHEAILHRRQ